MLLQLKVSGGGCTFRSMRRGLFTLRLERCLTTVTVVCGDVSGSIVTALQAQCRRVVCVRTSWIAAAGAQPSATTYGDDWRRRTFRVQLHSAGFVSFCCRHHRTRITCCSEPTNPLVLEQIDALAFCSDPNARAMRFAVRLGDVSLFVIFASSIEKMTTTMQFVA